jgi:hypothetical protein
LLAETSTADARLKDQAIIWPKWVRLPEGHSDEADEHCAPLGKRGLLFLYPQLEWVGENAPLPPKKQEKLRDKGQ